MNNCSCNNKKYLGEGCIELPSEFGSYFLVQNLFKELDTEEKRLIAQLNLGIDRNLNKIIKLVPTDTSEQNKLINQEQLTQAVQNEASERENAIRELDNKIPVFTNKQLKTLNSGITLEVAEKITIPENTNNLHINNSDDDVQIDANNLTQNAKNDVTISSNDGKIEIKSFDDLTLSADEGNRIIMNIDDGGSIVIDIGETQLILDEYKLQKLIDILNDN